VAELLAPATLEEALAALAGEDCLALGGGTQVVNLLKTGLIEPARLVWLGRIEALQRIERLPDGALRIGAGVTLDRLARSEPEVLARAAARVGNARVRAVATLGGHLAHADPRQDLPPVLLALGATLTTNLRSLPLADFFTGFMTTALREGELITHLEIPPSPARAGYLRFTPGSAADYPTVGVAAALTVEAGDVVDGRLALGAGAGRPTVVPWPGLERAPAAVAAAAGRDGYRRDMAALFTRRLLAELLA
jgi:aerobic carbon-monoxide dehydrogenase medium subunit